MSKNELFIYAVGAVLTIGFGWGITVLILRFARVLDVEPITVDSPDGRARLLDRKNEEVHILRGGTWIGVLERIAVYLCIVTGQPVLISAVIAVKGLGRYPELRDNPAAAERFLIGTGVSMLSAAFIALAAIQMKILVG